MGTRTVIKYTDDLTGEAFDPEAGEGSTVNFSVDGVQYEIDLTVSGRNDLLTALEPFTAAGRRVRAGSVTNIGSGKQKRTRRRHNTSPAEPTAAPKPQLSPELRAEIAAWVAGGEGVPAEVLTALGKAV